MSDIKGERKILHRAVLKTTSFERYEITCDPPIPLPPTASLRGNFVTFERKDSREGESHIIVDSDGERVRLSMPISTPFDELSRGLVFWAPGEMPTR